MRGRRKPWSAIVLGGLAVLATALPAPAVGQTGNLEFADCITGNTAVTACAQIPGSAAGGDDTGLNALQSIAASADGRSLYATSEQGDGVATFARDVATGALSFEGCITSDSTVAGCIQIAGASSNGFNTGLDGARSLAVAPSGTAVYVTTEGGDSVATFTRDPTSGGLTYAGCISSNSSVAGCTAIPGATAGGTGTPLDDLRSVAISADGRSAYAGSYEGDALATFARDLETGALTYAGCIASNTATAGCAQIPGSAPAGTNTGLQSPYSVAVAPDGSSVYVATFNGASVARFDRAGNGALTFRGCFTSALNVAGCTALPGATGDGDDSQLDNATSLTVSDDGISVYAVAEYVSTVTHFVRDPADGSLVHRACLTSSTAVTACTPVPGATASGDGTQLKHLEDVVASADGNNVYVSSYEGSLARFDRNPVSGDIAYGGCLTGSTDVSGCDVVPGAAANGAGSPFHSLWGLSLSPDGRSLYAVAEAGDAISHLTRELPSNQFSFGKLKRNKRKGTAKLPVSTFEHGSLELAGKGLKVASAELPDAGEVKLLVKAKGKKAKRLRKRGKVKVQPAVTFTPTGGEANTQSKRVKLRRKR
jgi:6-phosphogluconolactonase (cycloisomerase 2 family)